MQLSDDQNKNILAGMLIFTGFLICCAVGDLTLMALSVVALVLMDAYAVKTDMKAANTKPPDGEPKNDDGHANAVVARRARGKSR